MVSRGRSYVAGTVWPALTRYAGLTIPLYKVPSGSKPRISSTRKSSGDERSRPLAGGSPNAVGNIGCTSFFPSKNLGCYGDGGAIFTGIIGTLGLRFVWEVGLRYFFE